MKYVLTLVTVEMFTLIDSFGTKFSYLKSMLFVSVCAFLFLDHWGSWMYSVFGLNLFYIQLLNERNSTATSVRTAFLLANYTNAVLNVFLPFQFIASIS